MASSANSMWTKTGVPAKLNGNFSYNLYSAKLVKANVTALNSQGSNFFMNGTWNVYNVTITSTVIRDNSTGYYSFHRQVNTDVVVIVPNATGKLNVTDNWT
jgi:hypothetical protein